MTYQSEIANENESQRATFGRGERMGCQEEVDTNDFCDVRVFVLSTPHTFPNKLMG